MNASERQFLRGIFGLGLGLGLALACGGNTQDEAKDDDNPQGDGDLGDGDGDTQGDGDGDLQGDGDGDTQGDGDGDTPGDGDGDAPGGELCQSEPCGGACSGSSCGGAWTCDSAVACTRDLVEYCGCDGQTFEASSTCPPFAYVHLGPCTEPPAEGRNCRASTVVTDELPPDCEFGFLPEVVSGSYGACVPLNECGCSNHPDCEDGVGSYACHNNTQRCGHWL